MAIPKAKPAEPKKPKTLWHRLKNSALFVLFVVILITLLIIYIIIGISNLLRNGTWVGFTELLPLGV